MISKDIKEYNEIIDISSFSNGVYFVEFSNNKGTVVKRIIKE